MKHLRQVTAIIEREGNGYVALCPDLDVASQGETIESARNNLQEAVELFLETADPAKVERSAAEGQSYSDAEEKGASDCHGAGTGSP